jgi:hypothetical protein
MHHTWASKKTLLVLLALLVWSFFLWRAVQVFKPGPHSATFFNSDCAIPVLMSNDDRPVTLFNLYYYGVDRIGGWPFLVGQAVRRTTGFRWSPQSLSTMQTSWLFIGALVLAGLARKDRIAVVLAFLITLCLHGETRYQIFTLAVPYSWQTTALLLSWYSLRRLYDQEPGSQSFRSWKSALWLFITFFFSYLAVWMSVASIPFLLFLLCVEVLRAHLHGARHRHSRLLKLFIIGLIPILSAGIAERLQKLTYYRHSIKHYGLDFRTRFELDFEHLSTSLTAQAANLIRMSWWPFHLFATLVMLAVMCALVYALLRKRSELLGRLKTLFMDDTVIVITGIYGIALINLVLTLVVSHVRLNVYEDRYLILTSLFGPTSAILILLLIFNAIAQRTRIGKFGKPIFLLAGVALLLLRFPSGSSRPEYQHVQDIALNLAQKSPRAILLGGFWGTYIFAALQPVDTMTPVPLEKLENRMPWTADMVRQANQVVVEYRFSRLEETGQPPQRLSAYGSSLRLAEPKWYDAGDFAFALYVKDD